jgi:hypothetical protein
MILTTIAIVAQATPAASASPAAVDVATATTAKAWLISLQHGTILDAAALDADMTALLTPEVLSGSAKQFGPLGDPTSFEQKKTGVQGDTTFYVYDVGFKTGAHLNYIFAYDKAKKISAIALRIPQ